MSSVNIIRFLLGLALPSITLQGQDTELVPVFLQPDAEAEPITEVAAEDLGDGMPVLEAELAADGWRWAEVEGTFEGFTELASVGKNLNVLPGAIIRAEADPAAPILTVLSEGEEGEVLWADDWARVRFNKAIPLYFQATTAAQEQVEALAGELPVDTATVTPIEPEPIGAPGRTASGQVAGEGFVGLEGRLERLRASAIPFRDRPYRHQLVNREGDRIAYVDTERLAARRPVDELLDRDLVLYGELVREDGKLVLRATTVRFRPGS